MTCSGSFAPQSGLFFRSLRKQGTLAIKMYGKKECFRYLCWEKSVMQVIASIVVLVGNVPTVIRKMFAGSVRMILRS